MSSDITSCACPRVLFNLITQVCKFMILIKFVNSLYFFPVFQLIVNSDILEKS
jgi:hypothetical protein